MRELLLFLLLGIVSCSNESQRHNRDADITSFLNDRSTWHPMCLYTFDDPAIDDGTTVVNRVPNDACPFDALKPERGLVTSLNTDSTFWQLGVRLTEDPNNDTKRVQLSSISTVSARDFFTMAAVRNDSEASSGVTFEMVIRRRAITNHSMTLFSIANEFDNCVDPGFRLDLNEHQVLVFIYFLPVLDEGGEAGVEACYEQRLFSVDNSAACQLPPLLEPMERMPPVQITVTLDPSSERGRWKTDFYMSYTDVETEQRIDCKVHDEQSPPNAHLLNKLIEGRYQLYLGNSPRNVTSPRQRKRLASARDLLHLSNTSSLNATEHLRVVLKEKLMSISGPRLPKAMRIFGDNSLSLHLLGVTFPPLSEDTPLAYLRSKFADFKEQYGDQIVDYLVNLVQQKARDPIVVQQPQDSSDQSRSSSNGFSRATLFQGARSASFDLFHFAIYRRVVSEDQVNAILRQQLMPSRQFPSLQQTVRIPEDSLVVLNLTMLHGVYDDLRLELRGIPEFGQLLLFPNKTVVTMNNKDAFRELPLEYQRRIFFRPEADQNNDNLPLPNPVAFSRRLQPYASVKYGVADSLVGRSVNKSMEAKIDIFVDAVNDAPRPRKFMSEVRVDVGVPVTLDLSGDDNDGAPSVPIPSADTTNSSNFLSSFTFSNATNASSSVQLLKIERIPQFGKLFDCNSSCDTLALVRNQNLQSLESTRVYQNSVDIVNATYSTNLMYVYHGWGQNSRDSASSVVDELWYTLSDGDPGVFSAIAVIKFILVNDVNDSVNHNVLASVQLEEDSLQLLHLATLDPLAAFFNVRTRLKVTALPQHGVLFQYNNHDSSSTNADNISLESVGVRISTSDTIVSDFGGRVIYAPELDYFNLESKPLFTRPINFDYFEYQVLNTATPTNASFVVYDKSATAYFANGLKTRRIELEVVNVPDALLVLPPYVFTSNTSGGDLIPTSVTFEDPDSTTPDRLYQVNLEAGDGVSEFELGFTITDDDVMVGCPFERPCTLNRSVNGSLLVVRSSRNYELHFHIATQLYDPSHVQVTGTKTALSTALSALTFRDRSGISISHTSKFTLWVKRVDSVHESDAATLQTETTFTIHLLVDDQSDSIAGNNLFTVLHSELKRYVTTFLVLMAGWIVLSNGSCVSTGFCCCCCSKIRKKRRQKFVEQQRHFQAQVSQNDHEYSMLLIDLANLLLEPNMAVSACVLKCCVTSKGSPKTAELLTQAFILRSLLPLLETERQGTRFVFHLIATEYSKGTREASHQRFLQQHSTASKALACFCRIVGAKWLSALLVPGDDTTLLYLSDTVSEFERLLDRLFLQIEALPAEIVILCRGCAKLFQRDETGQSREMELSALHLVFFNHFLGPALLFPRDTVSGFTLSLGQQKTLQSLAYRIASCANQWFASNNLNELRSRSSSIDTLLDGTLSSEAENTATCHLQYETVLERISQSSAVTSTYDPSESKATIDCELMGLCLMNVHSLLDSYFLEFKREVLLTATSTTIEQIQSTITRMNRLLLALNWPLSSIHDFVEYARPELLNDPLLWNGFSFQEWQERAQMQDQQYHSISTGYIGNEEFHSILTDQVILEQDSHSPHDVDWLSIYETIHVC
ncbi:hypothetical protein DD237_003175 [Peronospora effusa]|uniref:Ras-GAP domain-containing protein n=1 Tax=Peronospora effusa TaxID=542832 RepID=A0A425BZI0_9STRA|nr:hypothetical protein DD237_003175 [Peronospora effusa]